MLASQRLSVTQIHLLNLVGQYDETMTLAGKP